MAIRNNQTESLEEMVFRNRNKSYGAYMLRKKNSKYTLISLIIAVFIIVAGVAYPVVAAYITKNIKAGEIKVIVVDMNKPPVEPPPTPPPPPPPPAPLTRMVFRAPVVSFDSSEVTDLQTQDDLSARGNVAVADIDDSKLIIPDKKEVVIEQPADDKIQLFVEEKPEFPGGDAELMRYLKENIKYPEEAKQIGITGKVMIQFVVEKDGSISNIKIIHPIGAGCDEEAVRVVESMPKWIPGKMGGKPVRVQFSLPVKFTLK